MTIGNAVISNTNLAREYFPDRSSRMTDRASTLSQGIANLVSFALGGMPMCHGAGGLAAHYRFGARTAGSNIIIGGIFLLLALFLGENLVTVLKLVPLAILGVLLAFAGLQLALMVQDIKDRKDLLVVVSILGITLAFNLAVAFIVGIVIAYISRSKRFQM
jgi:SulP family sulfate permease